MPHSRQLLAHTMPSPAKRCAACFSAVFPSNCDGDRPTSWKAMSAIRRHPSPRHAVVKLAENHVTIDRHRKPCAWRAGFAESRQQGKENA
jgi:hypothetical protein